MTMEVYYLQQEEYKLGIDGASRVYEFCFLCKRLTFTKNNTHIKCGINIPLFEESPVTEVTICPMKACKTHPYGICAYHSPARDDETVMNNSKWHIYFENKLKKQIMNHEKSAKPIEMYKIETAESSTENPDVNAILTPVSRDSIIVGRRIVIIDKANKKVWVYPGRDRPKLLGIINKAVLGIIDGMEDACNTRYLQELLKRDIESFQLEIIWAGEENSEFWATIDKNTSKTIEITLTKKEEQPTIQGPKIEMYQMNFHTGRGYAEYYTGGRSDSETKAVTLEPLKTSPQEFDKKRMVIVVDHQDRIIWHWLGSKAPWIQRVSSKSIPTSDTNRRKFINIIGSRIGRPLDNYDYIVIEEGKEPEKFNRSFQ